MSKISADYAATFKERLKSLREGKVGLTQSGLATAAELSTVTISKLEQGVNLPTFEALVALCVALDVTPNDLIGWPSSTGDQGNFDTRWFRFQRGLSKLPNAHKDAVLELVDRLSKS